MLVLLGFAGSSSRAVNLAPFGICLAECLRPPDRRSAPVHWDQALFLNPRCCSAVSQWTVAIALRNVLARCGAGIHQLQRWTRTGNVMRLKTFFSCLFAVLLGAALAVAVKFGYNLPGVSAPTDLFMFILDSPIGKLALANWGGQGGLLIAIALRAFPYSVFIGLVAGVVLGKLRFKRAFCYSVLWILVADAVFGYLVLSDSTPEQLANLQKEIGLMIWTDVWVYGWYFLALYIAYTLSRRAASRFTKPSRKLANAG